MKSASLALAFSCLCALAPAVAAHLEVSVTDQRGAAVEDAVIWLIPRSGAVAHPHREASIEQKNKRFSPLVTVVQAGTPVQFPNHDPIRHHIFSFSPAKTFEVKLYAGTPVEPVVFDKPGEVILGCNIHDGMLAYVYVVDSPWFAKTGRDGHAQLDGAPAGDYMMQLRHPRQAAAFAPQALRLGEATQTASLSLALRAPTPRATVK